MGELHCTEEQADRLIRQLAGSIHRLRCTALAVFVLEMFKPFGFLASQMLWVADPVLHPLIGRSSHDYARFLEDRKNIERLLAVLEGRPLEPPT